MRFFCEWMLAMAWVLAQTPPRCPRRPITDRPAPYYNGVVRERRSQARRAGAARCLGSARWRARRAQHGDLLDRDGRLARGGPRARNLGREILWHERARIGVHARVPDPDARDEPVRERGAPATGRTRG